MCGQRVRRRSVPGMTKRLQDKRALVTGAGQGIGRAVALAFATEGASVVAASRTASKMTDLPDIAPGIRPRELNVTDAEAIAALVAEEPSFDILVNVAGWVQQGSVLDCSEADWQRSFEQNVTSVFRIIKATLPGMLDAGGGSIVNVASVASSITGVGARAAYGASKAALIGLTKSVARDFIGDGVRCNALCPGTTASPSLDDRINESGTPEETRARFIARQPMGRLGTAEEMAAACLYLASDESGFATGMILVVDGGQTL